MLDPPVPVALINSMPKYLWTTSDKLDTAGYYTQEELSVKLVSR